MAEMFPMGFVDLISEALDRVLNFDGEVYKIIGRQIGPTDPSRTIAIWPEDWSANPEAKLIGALNREPYESLYTLKIVNLFISADMVEGRRQFSIDSKSIRAILYRDETLRLALAGLTEVFLGSVERVKKYDITNQKFLGSKTGISFSFICTTTMTITTEITK